MKVIFLSCFLIFTSLLFAQQEIDRQINKGLDACYDFRWNQADQIFRGLISRYPDDPRGYHFESSIYLWYYLGGNDKSDLDTFEVYSDKAISKGEAILGENEKSEIAIYTLGANYNYRAIAFGKAGNFLDAAWATKKSESYLSQVLEINPKKSDAYLGLGLYNFAVAQIPPAFKWALNLVGISGDKDTGVKYIEMTAEKGSYAKVEAQYYLAQIKMDFLIEYESAAALLKSLVQRFPQNLLFNYSYAVLLMKQKRLTEAGKFLDKVIKAEGKQFSQIISLSWFLKGDINFRNNNLDSARSYYLHFLSTARDNDYTGIAAYRLAVCYEAEGNREESVKYFEKAQTGNMDLDDDIYARRKGEIYAKRTLASSELDLIFISNMIESGKYKAALDSLNALFPILQAEKLKAEALLYSSEASYYMGKYQEAIDFANQALGLDSSNEKWVIPFSYYYIAKAGNKLGNADLVRLNAEKADEENNYDYQNKLRNLLYPLEGDKTSN
jgi:tetratricopeptide (TPR) repeat protein